MSDERTLTRSEAVQQVLAELDSAIAVDEFCRRVLDIWPSSAKNPLTAMGSYLRQEQSGKTLVFLDAKTIAPLPIAMRGVRFRIALDRREATRGVLILEPAFDILLRRGIDPGAMQLLDQEGRALPVRVTALQAQVDGMFGKETVKVPAFDLGKWFRAQGVRRGDSLLVTVEDWAVGRVRLEHEPAKRRRNQEIERRDRELANLLFEMLEESRDERILAYVAIPTAYARLADPGGYPGNHWLEVIERDERLRYDGFAIHYAEWRSPFERALFGEEPVAQAAFSPAQGRQVYHFKAALWHRSGLWRRIEIQGAQTLADFDGILRDAFDHDVFDHMGGFWKQIRRGKGKRVREVDAGDVDPMGDGSGASVQIAGLALAPGDELKYVYDFGDWIEHRLTLEEIGEPEEGAKYPRIVTQNRPRYKKCESCQAQGLETRATWICIDCSNRQQRDVLVCEKCMLRDHEEHYADKILY